MHEHDSWYVEKIDCLIESIRNNKLIGEQTKIELIEELCKLKKRKEKSTP
jgi:hypothetical protein